jgi:ribosomal protein S27AE
MTWRKKKPGHKITFKRNNIRNDNYILIIHITMSEDQTREWEFPTEKDEKPEEKEVCSHCGNDTFRVYITLFIDDARLYCAKCGNFT